MSDDSDNGARDEDSHHADRNHDDHVHDDRNHDDASRDGDSIPGRRVLDGLPAGGSLPVAVLAGAVVTVVLSVVPFSPVIGGAVTARRYDRGYARGVGAALVAGLLAAVPLALLVALALWIVVLLGVGVPPGSPGFGVFLAIVGVFFLAYVLGGSGVGGAAGVWTERNTDWTVPVVDRA